MSTSSDPSKDDLVQVFQPLADFKRPSQPTDETVHNILSTIRQAFQTEQDDAPLIDQARLDATKTDRLDEIAAPPACKPVLDDLTATYAEWIASPADWRNLQLVVLPAGDRDKLLSVWADMHGLPVLSPPDAAQILRAPQSLDLSGQGILVIPDLADWFLRHHNGLDHVRILLDALSATDRPVMIGCNSWAWRFLKHAVDAHLVLPTPYTFHAFDGLRLYKWLSVLSATARGNGQRFRLTTSGKDVFDDEETSHDFFARLAARSMGIPWVAWHMWRSAISDLHPDADENADDLPDVHDENTLWIAPPASFILPATHRQDALFVLHALLIHGALTPDLLMSVSPNLVSTSVLSALIESKFLCKHQGRIAVHPAAYPAARLALSNASYPMDEF